MIPAPVHVHYVADSLEGEEGYSHGKEDGIHSEGSVSGYPVPHCSEIVLHHESGSEQVVHYVGEEVGIFIIEQERQVHRYSQEEHEAFPEVLCFTASSRLYRQLVAAIPQRVNQSIT